MRLILIVSLFLIIALLALWRSDEWLVQGDLDCTDLFVCRTVGYDSWDACS